MEFCPATIAELMKIRRNKLPFFYRVLRAMSLIYQAFDGVVTPSGKIDFGLLKTAMPKDKTTNAQNKESLEQKLWKAANKLRKNIDAAEYKHIVLGLVFLKYISDSFEQLHEKLIAGEGEQAGADPEDPSVVDPMREKIHQNALHIKTLTKTRDVLLPQLMSGKLRITE